MSVINTNVNASLAQNALVKNARDMSSAMEQLSTGKRINKAGDDAAGLAIASKMTAQIRGLDQAVRNTNDAISMIQTAEGATQEISNMLQRMRELAVQASSDTNTADDITAINTEFVALRDGIDNIADTTQFNGTNVLDGTSSATVFQIGANDGQTMAMNMGNLQTDAFSNAGETLGVYARTITDAESASLTSYNFDDVTVTLSAPADVIAMVTALNLDTNFSAKFTATSTRTSTTDGALIITEKAGYASGTVLASSTGSTTGQTIAGSIVNGTPSVEKATAGLGADLSALTVSTASVLTTLDSAIEAVNTQRASYGAAINRLEYTADNLANVSTNTQASRSRIEDADYAKATTELARTQIIQQAGTAMLAQANQAPQGVLALLQ